MEIMMMMIMMMIMIMMIMMDIVTYRTRFASSRSKRFHEYKTRMFKNS